MDDTCAACGERNARDAGFCAACGEYLGWDQRSGPGDDVQQEDVQQKDLQRPDVVSPAEDGGPRSGATVASRSGRAAEPATVAAVVPEPEATSGAAGTSQEDPAVPAAAAVPARPAPALDRTCPDCQTVNAPERRFCRCCGHRVAAGEGSPFPAAVPAARTTPWWQRLGGHRAPGATREARRAYRRAVPLRYRGAQAAAVVLPFVLVGALLAVAGRDPVGSARGLWHDLRNNTFEVDGVEATADPADGAVPGWPPELAVDGSKENAWATQWQPVPSDGAAPEPCTEGVQAPARQTLLLEWSEPREIRSVTVLGGLPETAAEAAQVRRPLLLELRFDASCQALELEPDSEEQKLELDAPVWADRVSVSVLAASDVDAPLNPDRVAISSIRLNARPQ